MSTTTGSSICSSSSSSSANKVLVYKIHKVPLTLDASDLEFQDPSVMGLLTYPELDGTNLITQMQKKGAHSLALFTDQGKHFGYLWFYPFVSYCSNYATGAITFLSCTSSTDELAETVKTEVLSQYSRRKIEAEMKHEKSVSNSLKGERICW